MLAHVRRLESSGEAAVQMYFAAQSNRTNAIMRTLTVLTAIFLPLNLVTGFFWDVITFHLGVVALLGLVYRIETRHLPESQRVPAFSFLPMAVVMPVSYLLLTPLALFTLDSGNWETRRAAAPAPVLSPVPAAA